MSVEQTKKDRKKAYKLSKSITASCGAYLPTMSKVLLKRPSSVCETLPQKLVSEVVFYYAFHAMKSLLGQCCIPLFLQWYSVVANSVIKHWKDSPV